MKKMKINETMMLTLVNGIILIVMVVLRVFLPTADLMKFQIPSIAGISLVSLLLTHYLGEEEKKSPIRNLVFGALVFGVLPLLAGFVGMEDFVILAATGGVEYALISWIFRSMLERMENTAKTRVEPFLIAFILFLAFQAFENIVI